MICKKCSSVISDSAVFCPICGQETVNARRQVGGGTTLNISIPSTIWITGLRIFAWLGFLAIVGVGIYQWNAFSQWDSGELGFVIFLACLIGAFLSVSGIMVFLDMANDIRVIRRKQEK